MIKRAVALIVVCVMLVTALVGCSSTGKTAIELEDSKISINLYMLLLSRMKGNLASSYAFGSQALKASFWDTIMDATTGKTYDEYYTEMVLDSAKTYIAALALFDELGLKLPKSYTDEIDKELDELITNDGGGSKNAFNSILAEYGANYKVLREAFIMEAKISYLNDYLFGADGSKIAAQLIEDYYQQTYVRFRHIFFYTSTPVYVTDDNDEVIYYKDNEFKNIAYDKENGTKKEENGKVLKDKNGDIIFFTTDGKIAYDKEKGIPKPQRDSNGKVITAKLSAEELKALQDKTTLMVEQLEKGNYTLFDSYVEKYGEDEGMLQYPGGYFLTEKSDYDSPEVIEALFDMQEGEIRKVYSDYGIHIVMKYELEDGGYAKKENADFFYTSKGELSFLSDLKQMLLAEYLEKYKENIKMDDDLIKSVSMKSIGANFNY